jgi:hypothetical protein
VAKDGKYDIHVHFPANTHDGTAKLKIQDADMSMPFDSSAPTCTFKAVPLKQGNANLGVTLTHASITVGAWQVDVIGP